MFDLFRSRDKAVRILLGAILLVVAVSMVSYLIPGVGTGSAAAADENVIARVGDENITIQTAMQAVQAATRGRQIPPEMIGYFAPRVIESLISEHAMSYEAQRLGMRVSDDDVNAAIRRQLPPDFLEKDGAIKQDQLAQALANQNLSITQFIDSTRRGLLASRLSQMVDTSIVVTKAEVEQEYKRRNEKIKISYVLVKPAMFEQQVQISPAETEAYFNKNRQKYQTPEKRNLAIVLLDAAKVEQSITPTDADLQSVYSSGMDRFRTPERVKVRHILIPIDATTTDAQAQAKAGDVLKQLQGGADFAELAKKFSKDPGSAAKGGDLDFISRGQTVKPFEEAAFSLKPGELSKLVKTTYGYHIIQVQTREDARVKPFPEVRDVLASEYKKRKANESMQQLADRAAADLRKDPQHPQKAADDVKGELIQLGSVSTGDPLPQIGASPELQTAIAGLKAGGVSQPVAVSGGSRLAVVEVQAVTPAHSATLNEVRSRVEVEVRKEKVDSLVQKRVNALAAKAKAEGGDLGKAAKELGLEMKESADFNRQGAVEGLGSASTLGDAFAAKDGSIVGPLASADGKAVVKVLSHLPADTAGLAAQEATLRDEMKGKISRERNTLFQDGIRKELEKRGKVKVQQDALNRLLQSMRS